MISLRMKMRFTSKKTEPHLSSRGLIRPYLFEETVTGNTYLQRLKITIQRLNYLFDNENEVYFQQERAPPHFRANMRNFLDSSFNHRWIQQRRTATGYPPRFPDLTLLDLYLWEAEEHVVHHKTTNTVGTER